MLDRYRKKAEWIFLPVARRMDIAPNSLTWISFPFALAAGIFFYFSPMSNYFLLIGSIFVAVNGFLDGLDGEIARMSGRASKKGDFIDHALDRYSDVIIIGGIALSDWCDTRIGLVAIVGILLTSYMGTQAQAIGYGREYGGLLGRADRLAILIIAPLIQHFLLFFEIDLSFLEWVMIFFAIAANITAIQRFFKIMKWFGKE